jgi:hypothetical protein
MLLTGKGRINLDLKLWKTVATNWRTVDLTVEKLSIVQKATKKALEEIKENGGLITAKKFLSATVTSEEDDDLP